MKKETDLTQPYDKNTTKEIIKKPSDNTKTPPKIFYYTTIADLLDGQFE